MKGNTGESNLDKIIQAVSEVAKGMKAVAFYPDNHPSLHNILLKICRTIDEIPPPEEGLEIIVSKPNLSVGEIKIPEKIDAMGDFRNALFHRRTKKLILLPGIIPEEMKNFLRALSIDPDEIVEKGGLERILLGMKISKIWINKVEYEKLMEELKKEQELTPQEDEIINLEKMPVDLDARVEEDDIDTLLSKLTETSDSEEYGELFRQIAKKIKELIRMEQLAFTEKTIKVLAHHNEYPPGGNREIKEIATAGILELIDEDVMDIYVKKFASKSLQDRVEAQTVLFILGERAVKKILAALTEEKNLIVRKAMVDLVTKIGTPAIPYIVKYLEDERWYVVRNMVTILGGMGTDEVAQHIANTLQNSDPRVKKEAIKALSKNPSPISITALGECCFDGDENIATISISAIGTKKDAKAVQFLRDRYHARRFLFPDYRVSREIVDSLKNMGTESALGLLQTIALYNPLFKPKRLKELKVYAVQGIGKIKSEKAYEALEKLAESSDTLCRNEASKILQRIGRGKD